jgi:hypothetical protein
MSNEHALNEVPKIHHLAPEPLEQVLDKFDNFRAVMDQWLSIETFVRPQCDERVDLSSIFALITDHYHEIAENAQNVIRDYHKPQ